MYTYMLKLVRYDEHNDTNWTDSMLSQRFPTMGLCTAQLMLAYMYVHSFTTNESCDCGSMINTLSGRYAKTPCNGII
jgi:hypothetical protein